MLVWLLAMIVGTIVADRWLGTSGDDYGTPADIAGDDILPALFGLAVTVTVVWRRAWWSRVLTDPVPTRSWVWAVPAIVGVAALVATDWGRLAGAGPRLVVYLVAGVLTVALSEELFFRGLLLTALRDRFREPAAATLTIVAFTLVHTLGSLAINPLQLISTLGGGVVYYLTKRVAGSIWPAVLLHALFDFALFSITLGPGQTTDNRAPLVLLALLGALLIALVGVKAIRPGSVHHDRLTSDSG